MDLSEMRTLVRRDLRDEDSSNYRWTDDEIDRAVQRAVAELSRCVPRELVAELPTTGGSRKIDISSLSGCIRIEKVEYPVDGYPPSYPRFTAYGDVLTLLEGEVPDGSCARIYYLAPHCITADTSTVPAHLEDVVALGAAAYAVLALAQYVTGTAGIGGAEADRDYRTWGTSMLEEFRRILKKGARDNRPRQNRLYSEE